MDKVRLFFQTFFIG